MIEWYSDLYVDNYVSDNIKNIIEHIEKRMYINNIYCVTLASNERNSFDIINVNELLFDYYKKRNIKIIALTNGRSSAVTLVAGIVEEVYKKTGEFRLREYFE